MPCPGAGRPRPGTNTGFAEPRATAPDRGWITDTAVGMSGELIVFVANPDQPFGGRPATRPRSARRRRRPACHPPRPPARGSTIGAMSSETPAGSPATRIERDSMGEMEVPADALYGASTQRAVLNFPISGTPLPRRFLRALALVKLAAAVTNRDLGLLEAPKAEAIVAAAREVADGRHDAHFPIDVYQTGSGYLDQHEHERGHRAPGVGAAAAAQGPSQRRRQQVPVLERHDPDRAPALRRARDRGGADPRARSTSRRRWRRRPTSSGTSSRPAAPTSRTRRRSGSARSSRATPARSRRRSDARRPRATSCSPCPLGGTAVGHRDQRPPRVRGPRLRPALAAHRPRSSARRRTTSTPRPRSTRRSPPTARCARSRSACGRSRATSG